VLDDEGRERLVENIAGHILGGTSDEVLPRVFEYWTNVDPDLGKRVEVAVLAERHQDNPGFETEQAESERHARRQQGSVEDE
jgi:catalase